MTKILCVVTGAGIMSKGQHHRDQLETLGDIGGPCPEVKGMKNLKLNVSSFWSEHCMSLTGNLSQS